VEAHLTCPIGGLSGVSTNLTGAFVLQINLIAGGPFWILHHFDTGNDIAGDMMGS